MILTLNQIKRHPILKRHLEGKQVRIWSAQWNAWWRQGGNGYTVDSANAGTWLFAEALAVSFHAGREKRIEYWEIPATSGQ